MSLSQRIFEEKRRLIYPLVIALVVNVGVFALKGTEAAKT
jgi:hypothetical protein